VSGCPEGWSISKEIRVGLSAGRAPGGVKCVIANCRAGAIVGTAGPDVDDPQPASTSPAAAMQITRDRPTG
jgi:hypothetical protein